MFKKCKVVMLATNEKAPITLGLNLNVNMPGVFRGTKFHLYILSDDEIKKGDWCYEEGDRIVKFDNTATYPNNKKVDEYYAGLELCQCIHGEGLTKIIATTDSSLWQYDDTLPYPKTKPALPQPSQSFIEKYVEEYNKGNVITDVLVEYDEYFDEDKGSILNIEDYTSDEYHILTLSTKLKISKDNTITIRKVKDSWSRDEVATLIRRAFAGVEGKYTIEQPLLINKWIEENL